MAFEGDHRVGFLWLGFADIATAPDVFDVAGQVYSGLGELRNIPALASLVNGTADRVTFALSGVTDQIAALASAEARTVILKRMTIGVCQFDQDWQIVDPGIQWVWAGWSDFVIFTRGTDQAGIITQSVGVQVSTLFTRRRKASFRYWTLAETQRDNPGDLFWERTKLYARGTSKVWPRFQSG